MTDLERFRDHCRAMSTAEHKPECPTLAPDPPRWVADPESEFLRWIPGPPKPTCDGCNPDADRALFARLASEVDDYLDPHPTLWGNE